jgi:hypothetical protein
MKFFWLPIFTALPENLGQNKKEFISDGCLRKCRLKRCEKIVRIGHSQQERFTSSDGFLRPRSFYLVSLVFE